MAAVLGEVFERQPQSADGWWSISSGGVTIYAQSAGAGSATVAVTRAGEHRALGGVGRAQLVALARRVSQSRPPDATLLDDLAGLKGA